MGHFQSYDFTLSLGQKLDSIDRWGVGKGWVHVGNAHDRMAIMVKDEVNQKYPTRWGTWQQWLVVIAVLGVMAIIVSWDDLPFNRLTSIEAITGARRPADVTDKSVDLKLVQIPKYNLHLGDSPVRYDSTRDYYTFLVHDGLGNRISVTASAKPQRLVFKPLPVRVPAINFEPKPGDYVSVKGTVGFASLDLYIIAYEVRRVPSWERPLYRWD